jgi:DNA-3-methyladenine glycosylase II
MAIYQQSKKIMGTISYSTFKNHISLIEDLPLSNNKKKSIISLISNYDLVQSIKFDDTFQSSPPYELTKIFGIGPWTVQMFSIFHLGISNILPIGDLGFINAYKKYYKDESLKKLNNNSNKWSKYTTIVTWYLWSSYDSEPLYL